MVLTALALAGCTAHMDMTISPSGTYDVTLEMRDTTGTVLTTGTDCSTFADPSLVGSSSSGTVSAESIGSADDDAGTGCRVTIRGVEVSRSSGEDGRGALVVRDGDLYVVDLTDLATSVTGGVDPTVTTEDGDDGAPAPSPRAGSGTGPAGQAEPRPDATLTDSLAGVVDVRVSVTFPGAVVEADGGTVHGSTVTWQDAGALSAGVRATGYATADEGLSWWDRHATAVIASVCAAGVMLGTAAVLRWRRGSGGAGSRRTRGA
ncbi:LppM family (lipo)protein [Actinomyces faecalis]|uniref:LppM family (lipo)protein n=1 Tax=Actinomyces faecalis TaxID=2722820 RepID=UPI0015568E36|nr:translation initiation factor 2 [Actinomyces faecalis]